MLPRLSPILEGAAIGVFALVSTIAVARIGLEPGDPLRGVAVVFAPWTDAATVLTRAVSAGGRIVRFDGPSFIVVIKPDNADYVRRVKEAGALLIVDPKILDACLAYASTAQARQ